MDQKFKAAQEFCQKNNLHFQIVSEDTIRNDYLENCKFLWRYRFNNNHINWTDVDYIWSKLDRKRSVKDLLDILTEDDNKKAEFLYLIWYLVASSVINCNLKLKLNMNTEIWKN